MPTIESFGGRKSVIATLQVSCISCENDLLNLAFSSHCIEMPLSDVSVSTPVRICTTYEKRCCIITWMIFESKELIPFLTNSFHSTMFHLTPAVLRFKIPLSGKNLIFNSLEILLSSRLYVLGEKIKTPSSHGILFDDVHFFSRVDSAVERKEMRNSTL